MEFWIIWLIGMVIVAGTRIAINFLVRDSYDYEENKIVRIIINLFVIICIVIVGGITVGKFCGMLDFSSLSIKEDIIVLIVWIFFTLVGAGLTYFVGFYVLGLYYFEDQKWLQICFVVVFIISIVGWTIPISKYNTNIETIEETIVEKEERQLLYFNNIPVQEISGYSFAGTGGTSTKNELPYWYLDKSGKGVYDSVSAKIAKLTFIEDDESPYLEISYYSIKTTTINHNNGKEKTRTRTDKTRTEYNFYLPKSIMDYNLN